VERSLLLSILVVTQSRLRGEGCGWRPEMPTESLEIGVQILTNADVCNSAFGFSCTLYIAQRRKTAVLTTSKHCRMPRFQQRWARRGVSTRIARIACRSVSVVERSRRATHLHPPHQSEPLRPAHMRSVSCILHRPT
jgi:hypothetical protein